MVLSEKQRLEFGEAARPLIKWLCKNCHPHVRAIVDHGRTELVEGISSIPIEDYIRD